MAFMIKGNTIAYCQAAVCTNSSRLTMAVLQQLVVLMLEGITLMLTTLDLTFASSGKRQIQCC